MPDPQERQTTKAASPLTFADGTQYWMTPLNDRDIVELDEWVRGHYINMARKSFTPDMSQEERDNEMRHVRAEALTLTWVSGEGARLIATVDGMTQLVWQACKMRHPTLTTEELRKHLFNPENVNEANQKFRELNLAESVEKKGRRNGRHRSHRHGGKYTGR